MSDLNELFAELKSEIYERTIPDRYDFYMAMDALYLIDERINNGEFARAEQDAVS